MKSLKVLHLIDSGGFFGAEQMLLDLIIAQRALGHDAVLGSIAEPQLSAKAIELKARALGIPVKRFDLVNRPSYKSFQILKQYLLEQEFHLAHSHGYKASVLLALNPLFLCKFPVIASVHGYTSRSFGKMYIYEMADRFARLMFRANVAVSGKYQIKKHLFSYQAAIPNGLGPELSPWQGEAELNEYLSQYKVIGSVGRLSAEKGFDVLIDAFALLAAQDDSLRLLLLGDGGLQQSLVKQINDLSLQNKVWLAGYRENAAAYIKDMALFVNSSYTEGLPITLLEAMRGETPIVASSVGGIPTLLKAGQLGALVRPGDKQQLALAMQEGLSQQALAKAKAAKQEFDLEYRREIMAKRYIDLYKKLL